MAKTEIEGLTIAVSDILKEYAEDIGDNLEEVKADMAKRTVKVVRENIDKAGITKRTGDYRASIGSKKVKTLLGNDYVIYARNGQHVKTHLLENGHVVKNKYNTYGRTRAFPHWKPAEEDLIREYTKSVEEIIKKK